jgi:nicotinate-nucleotide pyrophosphorylase (carboxylating)
MDMTDHLIDTALREDIGSGDITTDALITSHITARGAIIAKEPLVVAGLHVTERVFKRLDPDIRLDAGCREGDAVEKGFTVLEVNGDLRALLEGERTALNFLQRLSGIATHVRSFADQIRGKKSRLVDTRKTTPGWRVLEKYAVRVGGAWNHRMGLYDGVLIKDNHIAVCGGIKNAVEMVREKISHLVKIEVEVTGRTELKAALAAGVDVIMLDNMDLDQIREAVGIIGGKALVEVSGGVTKDDLMPLADLGVDIISSGSLTHSARCVDLSMQIFNPPEADKG